MTYIGPTNGSGNNPDPNVIDGWTVQGSAAQTALSTGTIPAGYAEQGIVTSQSLLTTTGNGNPGAPGPLNPSGTASILENPGYGSVPPSMVIPGTAINLPSGFSGVVSALPMAFTSGTATYKPQGTTTTVAAAVGATIPGGSVITATAASVVTTL
jgi:hypothetical protein